MDTGTSRAACMTASLARGALLLSAACLMSCATRSLEVVVPNDNRKPAGASHGDTLTIHLVVRPATWFPSASDGSSIEVDAFAEEGELPRIPGPLIRVTEGTVIEAHVRNGLADSTISIYGLATAPSPTQDHFTLAPGEARLVRFVAGAPGTYMYAAGVGQGAPGHERETTSGAIVIDPVGGSPPDRVFVMNIWSEPIDSTSSREVLAINGRSFPFDERLTETLGDSIRWRWVNATAREHPMHLHGFYFRVDAAGDGAADTTYAPEARRLVVTENMPEFTTMQVVWQPDRVGNWLFHCHIGFHVSPDVQLDPPAGHPHLSADIAQHMAGLVLAITVEPPPAWRATAATARHLQRLYVQEGTPRHRAARALGYVLGDAGGTAPKPDSVNIPGPVLVLTRGEPTDVTILNRMREPTVVHWHGLELESWSDGMAGWSGMGARVAPPVMPADSFTAHLLSPRAGTFMYHTHLNDIEQLTSGLYGAIVVLEPGARFDPSTDHVYVLGWDSDDDPAPLLLNGDSLPAPATYRAGVAHRMRFVNIGAADAVHFEIRRDTTLVAWQALAVDGADLPPSQAIRRPARVLINVGQTADFLFTPPARGTYRLMVTSPSGKTTYMEQRIVVR